MDCGLGRFVSLQLLFAGLVWVGLGWVEEIGPADNSALNDPLHSPAHSIDVENNTTIKK